MREAAQQRGDYVRSAGYQLDNPTGPALLVLLHGLGGTREQPLDLLSGAQFQQLSVLAPDSRSHGRTTLLGHAEDFTFASMVDDLYALITALRQERKPTYLAGISMGAAVALRSHLSGRLDVRGLALVRPAFSDRPEPDHLLPLLAAGRHLERDSSGQHLEDFEACPEYRQVAAVSAAAAESLRNQIIAPQAYARRKRLTQVPRNRAYDDVEELATVSVPTLVIGAERDPVHPLALAERWSSSIPGAHQLTVPARDEDRDAYDRATRSAVQSHLERVLDLNGRS